jgi:hypothetical protein
VTRSRKFEDGNTPAGSGDPNHLCQAAVGISHIPEAKSNSNQLERVIGKRKPLCIRFDKSDSITAPNLLGFASSSNQHLMTKVGTNYRNAPSSCSIIRQRKITGAGTQIENRAGRGRTRGYELGGFRSPLFVNIQTQQVIQQIITRSDLHEHAANANFTLIE